MAFRDDGDGRDVPDMIGDEMSAQAKNETRRKELERIEGLYGHLQPRTIVEEAEPEESPLHDCFEWNDGVAAQSYRESQARRLVRMVYIKDDATGERSPAFYHVTSRNEDGDNEPAYVSAVRLRDDDELFESALGELLTKLSMALDSVEKAARIKACAKLDPVRKLLVRAKAQLESAIER